jgi:hypothetical protein
VSQAYLTSLNQPPTPARNRSGANNATEIKTLQTELDALVAQYEEATRVLARQRIMDRMSDTLVRGRIEKMEKELDAVQQLEDGLEGMIGRMPLVRDLTLFEMSKFEALRRVTTKSRQQLVQHTENKLESSPERSKKCEIPAEMVSLQNLVGVRDSEECRKLLAKANLLDQDLSQASRTAVNHALQET